MADNYPKTSLWSALKSVASDFANDRFSQMRKTPDQQYKPTDMVSAMPGRVGGAGDTVRRRTQYEDYAAGAQSAGKEPMGWEDWHQLIYNEPPPDLGQGLAR